MKIEIREDSKLILDKSNGESENISQKIMRK